MEFDLFQFVLAHEDDTCVRVLVELRTTNDEWQLDDLRHTQVIQLILLVLLTFFVGECRYISHCWTFTGLTLIILSLVGLFVLPGSGDFS